MVEVFKTDVQNNTQAKQVLSLLKKVHKNPRMNFDLHDCDKILRVEGIEESFSQVIIRDLNKLGFICEILN